MYGWSTCNCLVVHQSTKVGSVPVRARVRSGHMTCVGRIHGNENCLTTKLMLHHRQQKLHLIIKQAARCATRKLSLIQLIKTKAHSTHKLHFYSFCIFNLQKE